MITSFLHKILSINGVLDWKPVYPSEEKSIYKLEDKITEIIDWYEMTSLNGKSKLETLNKKNQMKNLICKIADWYEITYSDYEVERELPSGITGITTIFDNRTTLQKQLQFINVLNDAEKRHLVPPAYKSKLFNSKDRLPDDLHFYVFSDGTIESVSYKSGNPELVKQWMKEWPGQSLKDILPIMELNEPLVQGGELSKVMNEQRKFYQTNAKILEAAMYQIANQGTSLIGPRRAYLFAEEFQLEKEKVMPYAINIPDIGLGYLLSRYFKDGGSPEIDCLVNYRDNSYHNYYDVQNLRSLIQSMPSLEASILEVNDSQQKTISKRQANKNELRFMRNFLSDCTLLDPKKTIYDEIVNEKKALGYIKKMINTGNKKNVQR